MSGLRRENRRQNWLKDQPTADLALQQAKRHAERVRDENLDYPGMDD